jgi:hypothetical protein
MGCGSGLEYGIDGPFDSPHFVVLVACLILTVGVIALSLVYDVHRLQVGSKFLLVFSADIYTNIRL